MIGSLTELSQRPGMPSEVTLRKLIRRYPDFPIVRRGDHGRKYQIDLEEAERFVLGLRERRQLDPLVRRQLIKELGLNMLAQAEGYGTD